MTSLSYERYCAEIIAQTDILREAIKGADMTAPVPSCPGWNLGQLLRHSGGALRWVDEIVRTKASEPPSNEAMRDLSSYANEDVEVLDAWLAEGAAQVVQTLRTAGSGTKVWTPLREVGETTDFFARRMTHETVIHRADAQLAAKVDFTVDHEVAVDGLDEWMELGALPMHLEVDPQMRELLGAGRSVHLHATDIEAEWLLDFTGDAITWRRAHEKAAVAVRGPVTDLLLLIYRRQPINERVEVLGDQHLLEFWLERVSFG